MKRLSISCLVSVAFLVCVASCTPPTSFRGESTIPQGPQGCAAVCQSWSMELAGMIQMGEYSNGCICVIPGGDQAVTSMAAGAAAAAAGVIMQKQRSDSSNQTNED